MNNALILKAKHAATTLLRLLYVPKCAACGARLSLREAEQGVLCPLCFLRYENEKDATCPVCAARLSSCTCLAPGMPKTAARKMVKLVRYRPREDETSAQMIYTLKHKNLVDLQRFFAGELAAPLAKILPCDREEYLVTYPPRSRSSYRRDGFDHAAALGRELAAKLGVAFLPTLSRGNTGVQKKLSRTARLQAAAESYALRQGVDLHGKHVILVDDIATTGATLTAACRLLRRAGAKEVIFAVLAITPAAFSGAGHG